MGHPAVPLGSHRTGHPSGGLGSGSLLGRIGTGRPFGRLRTYWPFGGLMSGNILGRLGSGRALVGRRTGHLLGRLGTAYLFKDIALSTKSGKS